MKFIKNKKAFTLIELLVVIAVIGYLFCSAHLDLQDTHKKLNLQEFNTMSK